MKKNLFILLCIFPIFFTQKIFSQNIEIIALEDKSAEISKVDGKTIVLKSTENGLDVSIVAMRDKKTLSVIYALTIKNNSQQDFDFNEENLSVFEGNFQTDEWEEKHYLTASKFYAKRKAELSKNLNLNYFYYDYDYDLNFDNPPPLSQKENSIRSPEKPLDEDYEFYKKRYPFRKSNSNSTANSILFALEFLDFLDSLSSDNELDFLQKNLLFSKTISAGESYTGLILVEEGSKPDYKIAFKIPQNATKFPAQNATKFPAQNASQKTEEQIKSESKSEENMGILEFKFTHSNREDILHPFRDRNYGRHAFTFSLTLPNERWGIYYIFAGKIIGAYGGISFPFGSNYTKCFGTALNNDASLSSIKYNSDLDSSYLYKTSATGKTTYEMSGFCAGLTLKTIPHTWLMLGCSFDLKQDYYEGYVYYKDKADTSSDYTFWTNAWFRAQNTNMFFSPQIGASLIFDFIDISGIFEWRINSGPKFELMFGFAI